MRLKKSKDKKEQAVQKLKSEIDTQQMQTEEQLQAII